MVVGCSSFIFVSMSISFVRFGGRLIFQCYAKGIRVRLGTLITAKSTSKFPVVKNSYGLVLDRLKLKCNDFSSTVTVKCSVKV